MHKNHTAPLFHITKRKTLPWYQAWLIRGAAIVLALLADAVVTTVLTGENPIAVYATMFSGALGTKRRIWMTAQALAILLCVSLAVTPAFKMRFWNVGGEGQILAGGLATASCMILLGDKLPGWLLLTIMLVCALAAGAIWGAIPAIFKAKWNTNETLFTLMMNYIAIQLTAFFVSLWENPFGSNSVGIINSQSKAGWLPNLLSDGYNGDYGWNVIIVLTVTLIMYLYMNKSKHGYEIAVIGDSENTARYAGIRVNRAYVRTIILSGAVCGLAGFVAVSGASHSISTATAGGRGFTAIIVAWLAQFNSIVMIIFSFLIVFLQKGAQAIASSYNLSQEVSEMITGIILFFLLGSEFFVNYVIRFNKGRKVRK